MLQNRPNHKRQKLLKSNEQGQSNISDIYFYS
jgi:hypothetical protein